MSKFGRMWDWLLPGLIALSQMGAFAYYIARAEEELPRAAVAIAWRDAA